MAESVVKNAWDLLVFVQQRLAAGDDYALFTFAGAPGSTQALYDRLLYNQEGAAYDLRGDFLELLLACRDNLFSYAISTMPGEPATLTIGHNLPQPEIKPGDLFFDLRGQQIDIRQMFDPDNPSQPLLRIDITAPDRPGLDDDDEQRPSIDEDQDNDPERPL